MAPLITRRHAHGGHMWSFYSSSRISYYRGCLLAWWGSLMAAIWLPSIRGTKGRAVSKTTTHTPHLLAFWDAHLDITIGQHSFQASQPWFVCNTCESSILVAVDIMCSFNYCMMCFITLQGTMACPLLALLASCIHFCVIQLMARLITRWNAWRAHVIVVLIWHSFLV